MRAFKIKTKQKFVNHCIYFRNRNNYFFFKAWYMTNILGIIKHYKG